MTPLIGTSSIDAPLAPSFQLSVAASRTDASALRWNTSLFFSPARKPHLFFLDRSFQSTIALPPQRPHKINFLFAGNSQPHWLGDGWNGGQFLTLRLLLVEMVSDLGKRPGLSS